MGHNQIGTTSHFLCIASRHSWCGASGIDPSRRASDLYQRPFPVSIETICSYPNDNAFIIITGHLTEIKSLGNRPLKSLALHLPRITGSLRAEEPVLRAIATRQQHCHQHAAEVHPTTSSGSLTSVPMSVGFGRTDRHNASNKALTRHTRARGGAPEDLVQANRPSRRSILMTTTMDKDPPTDPDYPGVASEAQYIIRFVRGNTAKG
jgi:hypothetical protein